MLARLSFRQLNDYRLHLLCTIAFLLEEDNCIFHLESEFDNGILGIREQKCKVEMQLIIIQAATTKLAVTDTLVPTRHLRYLLIIKAKDIALHKTT